MVTAQAHDSALTWLERSPLPMGVTRGGIMVYGNAAILAFLDIEKAALIGMSFLELIAPEDRDRMRERHARRLRGEKVPDSYEFVALRPDGQRRDAEIWVSLTGGGDVVFALYDRTSRKKRQRYLREIARVGAAVQAERSDDAIFTSVREALLRLDMAVVRTRPDGDTIVILDSAMPSSMVDPIQMVSGQSSIGMRGPLPASAAEAWRDGSAFVDDVPLAAQRFAPTDVGDALRGVVHEAGLLRGVQLRIDVGGVPRELLFLMSDWLQPEDVPALTLFAAQVAAALDASRAIDDLSRRNAALTALNRIGEAAGIAPGLPQLFESGVGELVRVLGCSAIAIYLIDVEPVAAAERVAVLAYQLGGEVRSSLNPSIPLRDSKLGVVVAEGRPRVWSASEYDELNHGICANSGDPTVVASVPLVVRSKVVGVMNATYARGGTVIPEDIGLLQAAGAHFAAAVEANRLFADLRKSYADLACTQERLVQRERLAAIGELSAVVAHEVRNPLGVLFNSLGTLKRMTETDGALALIEIMWEEARRINHIVGDLLDFARPTLPSIHPERIDVVLDEAVEAAVSDAKGKIQIVREFGPNVPAVPIDVRLMRQALLNLALNAVQAMPTGGTMTLRLMRERSIEHDGQRDGQRDGQPDGQHDAEPNPGDRAIGSALRLEIEDTGSGVPVEVQSRIFEPFFTTRATGTGLGLAVVKRIVEGHGGEASLKAIPGRSTTFIVRLPLDHSGYAETQKPE